MLNLTLTINISAAVALAASVVIVQDSALAAIALAYASGLLTSWASRYQLGVAAETQSSTSGQSAPHVP